MTLVERQPELSALDTWWRRVREANRSATVVVEGPAGIGKTALLDEWLNAQSNAGYQVLTAQADDYASRPLAPIRWSLEAAALEPANSTVAMAREQCLDVLRTVSSTAPPDVSVATLLARYLQAAGHGDPVIVAIEDIHVADDDTLRLCIELVRLAEVSVLLIVTRRPDPERSSIGFGAYLQRQVDVGKAHFLRPTALGPDGVRQLAARTLGHEVDEKQFGALSEIARGNPLFVGLSARLIGDLPDAGLPHQWPEATRDELLRRFVPEASAEAMLGARLAEFGRFTWESLDRLVALTGTEEKDVRAGLSLLKRQGVLRPTIFGVEFAHPLIREAFANLLSPEQRAELHLHLARALFDSGEPEFLYEAATHLSAAGLTDSDGQLAALIEAANSAMWVSPAPAASWFRQVRISPSASPEQRVKALRGEIISLSYSGQSAKAWKLCQRVMAAVPPKRRTTELIEAAGSMAYATCNIDVLPGLLDEAIPAVSGTPTRALAAAGQLLSWDTDSCRPNYERCLVEISADPDRTTPMTYVLIYGCAALLGDVANVEMLRELMLRQAEPETPVQRDLLLACTDLHAHHLPADLGRSRVDTARRPDRISIAGRREVSQSFRYFQTGQWDALLDYVPAQLELLEASGNNMAIPGPVGCAAAVLIEREQWDDAAELLARADWPRDPSWGPLLEIDAARIEAGRGKVAAAIDRLTALEHKLRTCGLISMYSMAVDLLVHLHQGRAEHAIAKTIAHRGREYIGDLGIPMQDAYSLLALAATDEDPSYAFAAYDAAYLLNMPFIKARCEVSLARLGDAPADRLQRAHNTFKRLGAVTERNRTEKLMHKLRIGTPRGQGITDRLSVVESSIVLGVLKGHTNRRIATDLHYSPKTIEMHLSRIYARTGRSGRVDLVKAVTEGDVALADT